MLWLNAVNHAKKHQTSNIVKKVREAEIVKEVMACDVSPVAMFSRI